MFILFLGFFTLVCGHYQNTDQKRRQIERMSPKWWSPNNHMNWWASSQMAWRLIEPRLLLLAKCPPSYSHRSIWCDSTVDPRRPHHRSKSLDHWDIRLIRLGDADFHFAEVRRATLFGYPAATGNPAKWALKRYNAICSNVGCLF